MKHIIVVLIKIEAPRYEDALYDTIDWVGGHREGNTLDVWPQGTVSVRAETFFERDNDGQRVLYLPTENLDVEAGEIEVVFDDKEEEEEGPYNGLPD